MDTPIEEQQMFQNVTCNIAASEDEITEPNTLSEDFINCVSYKLLEYNMDYISLFYTVQNSRRSINAMQVEVEVSRLEELKSSKMKELVLKKRTELEEICRKTHLVPEIDGAVEYAVEAIESGNILSLLICKVFLDMIAVISFAHFKLCLFLDAGIVDPACVLEQFERQVAQVKEEALGRKDILEKVEKWLAACNEESWLEEYNRVSCLYSPF